MATWWGAGYRTALALPLVLVHLTAQEFERPFVPSTPVPADPPRLLVLQLQNLVPLPRREGVAVVVPFRMGEVAGLPVLHVQDTATAWQPFGARWPDGSLRQALCLFTAELGALGESTVPLVPGPGPELPAGDIALPAFELQFVARQANGEHRGQPVRVADLEHNALRRVELRRGRIGRSGLVAEAIVTAWRGQPWLHVELAVFCSDPTSPAVQCDLDELAVESRGLALVLRHAGRLAIDTAMTDFGSRTVWLQKRPLGDGQGLRRTGVLVPPLAGDGSLADDTLKAACVLPLLGATQWISSGAFGPFGHVPPPPPWLERNALRAYFAKSHASFVAGDRDGDAFAVFRPGLAKMAGQTGDQDDFGVCKLSLVAHSALPSFLHQVEVAALQETCRPVHFFEADCSPVEPAKHPEWVVWSGRTHWHHGVSKDRLGKPVPEPRSETHGWTGKDREHWSNNTLAAYALLTGAHWARLELQNEVRLYLAGQTVDPALTTSHAGAPRGAGRTALSAAWTFLVTGDDALRARMDERMAKVYAPEWDGRTLPADAVRPLAVCNPDARMLDGKQRYWNPWQEALAAIGFAAHHRVTGNAQARSLAEAVASNVVRHGWLVSGDAADIAAVMRWSDGAPLTAEQWRAKDPATVAMSAGATAFAEWAIGAVEIARVAAERDGDEALRTKCEAIQRSLRTGRRAPPDGGPDRFGEWDAVVWPQH